MLIAAGVFVLILTMIFGAYWVFVVRPEDRDQRALRRRLKARDRGARTPKLVKSREKLSTVGPLDAALDRWIGASNPLAQTVERSGLKITVGAVLMACVLLAIVSFGAVALLARSTMVGLLAGAIGAVVPLWYVRRAANKRLATFEEQFPEAIDLMARALRAGHALTTSLEMVGQEIPDPVGTEFRLLFEQQNYGMSLVDALRGFAARVPLLDGRFFVTALLTQRETGGNLSEVLDNLATVIRERFKVKRQVRVISAHGRITGWVLGFLPPVTAGVLFVLSPSHMRLLIDDPLGVDLVMMGVALQVVGVLIIKRIVNVEY